MNNIPTLSRPRRLSPWLLAPCLALGVGTLSQAGMPTSVASTIMAAPVAPAAPTVLKTKLLPDLFIYHFYPAPKDAGLPAGFPHVEYCGGNDGQGGPAKRIYFQVHNRSSAAAPASQVRVRFVNPQSHHVSVINLHIQAIAGQAHVVKKLDIPQNCYSPGSNAQCNFSIYADPDAMVAERFENNNVQSAYCVGPSF